MENKFDKNFENSAWSEMQKLLDRDLPVAEKKRRGLVFWLFLMGGLMLFGSGVYFKLKIENEKLNTASNTAESNKKTALNASLITDELNKKTALKTALINAELNKKTALKTALINAELNEKTALKTALINAELNEKTALKTASINAELNEKTALDNGLINAELNNEVLQPSNIQPKTYENRTPQYKSENAAILSENSHTSSFNYLKILEPQLISVYDSIFFIQAIKPLYAFEARSISLNIVTSTFKSSKVHFGVSAGVYTEGALKMDGGQIGFIAHKYLKKNWSINAGFNYRKTTVNNGDKWVYYQVELRNNLGTALPYPTSLSSAKKLALNNLDYLELPIHFSYQFNRKWSMSGGIKTAYLLSAKVSTSSDSTLFVFQNGGSNKDKNFVAADGSSNAKLLGLNRFDFAAIGGINYHLTPKIHFSLRYDYGFKNVLNRDNWSAYNRFLGLNAAYYFR